MLVLLALIGLVGASVDSPACHEFCKAVTRSPAECRSVKKCDSEGYCEHLFQDVFGFYVEETPLDGTRRVSCASVEIHFTMANIFVPPSLGRLHAMPPPPSSEDVPDLTIEETIDQLLLEKATRKSNPLGSGLSWEPPMSFASRYGLVEDMLRGMYTYVDPRIPRYVGSNSKISPFRADLNYVQYSPFPDLYPMGNLDSFCQLYCDAKKLDGCANSVCLESSRMCTIAPVPCHYAWISMHEYITRN